MRTLILFLCWGGLLTAQPAFSPEGGFFERDVTVHLSSEAGETIHYTLDGSRPTSASPVYDDRSDLYLTETTVVRAISVNAAGAESFPYGNTYFIDEPNRSMVVVSIGMDPWRLFDNKNGWFKPGPRANTNHWKMPGANFWTRKEHPGHLEIFMEDGTAFSGQVGYRMFGGMSRLHPQKSLSVSCRKRYGWKRIDYPIFGDSELDSFKFLVLRNGGSDWSRSHFRDALLSGLLWDESWDLEHQASIPAAVYINGTYWGLYHIREKINKTFVADHRGYDKDSLDLLEHAGTVKAGSNAAYGDFLLFIDQHSFYEVSNYQALKEQMDVDNFMRLQIAQMYFDNRDAGGNIRYYRPHRPDEYQTQKWKWILYDLDYSFGLHDTASYAYNTLEMHAQVDGPAWPNPPWSTRIQRKLLANAEYRRFFVNRSLDYLQKDFSTAWVKACIRHTVKELEPEMPRALERWGLPLKNWYTHVNRIQEFAEKRPYYVREHLREFFAAGADRKVQLQVGDGGTIVLNDNITIDDKGWEGQYFAKFPLRIRAQPKPGYRFVAWDGVADGKEQWPALDIDLKADQNYAFAASFTPYLHVLANKVVITEVAGKDAAGGAWVEIHNRSSEAVSIRDWLLTTTVYQKEIRLPAVQIPAGGFVVLYDNQAAFQAAFPQVKNAHHLRKLRYVLFGARLGLYSKRGAQVDEVQSLGGGRKYVQAISSASTRNDRQKDWHRVTEATPGEANAVTAIQISMQRGDLWIRIVVFLVVVGVLVLGMRRK
ncbi:MAG: CotH kinase family protein [Bacteroidota bacterium]